MIEVKNITHYFGDEKILDSINLDINSRTFNILTGPSGSGKSTLLSIIAKLLNPTKGEVIYHSIPPCSIDTFRNRYIGFIFQFHYLIAHLSILENIKMVTNKSTSDILNLLRFLGIEEVANKYPSNISGGQRQRAAIARALINEPKYIFADEPTGSLDSKNSKIVFDILREVDATILVATHDKSLIQKSDNIITMKDGKIC